MNAFRDVDQDDEWDDDGVDADHDADDADDEPTVPCPLCRRPVLEDAPWCPSCEQYISAADHARAGKPLWIVVTALICLGIAIWWVFAAF